MAKEKKQFTVGNHNHHGTVGRLGGGYAVGGIPWFQLYYGGYGYYGGHFGGMGTGNNNSSGQESGDGTGDVSGSGGDAAGDGGGSGAM
jgi:hypothetical protein